MIGFVREPGIVGVTVKVGPVAWSACVGLVPVLERYETTKGPPERAPRAG